MPPQRFMSREMPRGYFNAAAVAVVFHRRYRLSNHAQLMTAGDAFSGDMPRFQAVLAMSPPSLPGSAFVSDKARSLSPAALLMRGTAPSAVPPPPPATPLHRFAMPGSDIAATEAAHMARRQVTPTASHAARRFCCVCYTIDIRPYHIAMLRQADAMLDSADMMLRVAVPPAPAATATTREYVCLHVMPDGFRLIYEAAATRLRLSSPRRFRPVCCRPAHRRHGFATIFRAFRRRARVFLQAVVTPAQRWETDSSFARLAAVVLPTNQRHHIRCYAIYRAMSSPPRHDATPTPVVCRFAHTFRQEDAEELFSAVQNISPEQAVRGSPTPRHRSSRRRVLKRLPAIQRSTEEKCFSSRRHTAPFGLRRHMQRFFRRCAFKPPQHHVARRRHPPLSPVAFTPVTPVTLLFCDATKSFRY